MVHFSKVKWFQMAGSHGPVDIGSDCAVCSDSNMSDLEEVG